jgi:DNA repair ATPase RecN
VANLRYEIDVKLDSDRKAEMTKARQAYERAMTPTTFEKELFAATVKFERQALRIEEQKKNIRGMMTLVEEYPDALDNYREELKKMDDNMKSLAKKYGEEIDMLKNEQLIIASNRAASRPDIQPADRGPASQAEQEDLKKAA